jgi:hypothetical protein
MNNPVPKTADISAAFLCSTLLTSKFWSSSYKKWDNDLNIVLFLKVF